MKVALSPRSLQDLQRIQKYLATQSGDQIVADRYVRRLINACETLGHLVEKYPPYHASTNLRMKPFGNYVILFVIREEEVRVSHIRHAARRVFRG